MTEERKFCELLKLNFETKDLAPTLFEEQVGIHHTKHHQVYVNRANAILKKLDVARKAGNELDLKAISVAFAILRKAYPVWQTRRKTCQSAE